MTASAPAPSMMPPTDPRAGKEALLHFAGAFLFLVLGLAALLWNSERLSQGAFTSSQVVGGLHWLTLGWLSISIFGATRVFAGVALGSQQSKLRLTPWVFLFWSLGALIFPAGLILSKTWLIVPGVLLIGLGLLLYTIHIVPALVFASRGGLTRWYLALALVSLWCTWLLGTSAALSRAGSAWSPSLPPGYFQAHLLMAVFGWVGATIAGVGSHLIPMFALSRDPNPWPVKIALPLWVVLQALALFGAYRPEPFLRLAWITASIVSTLWALQVTIYFQRGMRKQADPGLLLAGGATALLIFSWIALISTDAPVTFIGLLIIGWLTLFTLGIYHRVVPFLAWYTRFAHGAGRGPVPKVKDLLNERLAYTTTLMGLAGALIWGLGLSINSEMLTYAGSLIIFCGSVCALGQIRWLAYGQAKPALPPQWVTHRSPILKGETTP